MKVLVTGAGGTLGPHALARLSELGHSPLPFDRKACSSDDAGAVAAYLQHHTPQAVLHMGFGSEAFAAQLASWCAQHGLPMLFTSTAMVFDHQLNGQPNGPHHPGDERNAKDDYGKYKIRCEDAIASAYPAACIARLGWQIHAEADGSASGNNMLAALDSEFAKTGMVRASTAWVPACSFMPDTAAALVDLLTQNAKGVHHIDANAQSALTFAQIAQALSHQYRRAWTCVLHGEYRHDQRLAQSVAVPSLTQRLAQGLTQRPLQL